MERFTRTTTVLNLLLVALGILAAYVRPPSALAVIAIICASLISVILYAGAGQVMDNTKKIEELSKTLNLEKRFNSIELQLAEQRGKLK